MFLNPPNLVSVLTASNTPPGSPVAGDLHITLDTPTGAWASQPYKYTRYNGSTWDFITPFVGSLTWSLGSNTLYLYTSSNTWVTPATATATGAVGRIPYFNTTTSFADSVLKQDSSKIILTTGSENPAATFQVLTFPASTLGYSYSNWNSTSQAIPFASACPTDNGGDTPVAFFPAAILGRSGVPTESYANFVEFKIGRYEHSSTNARTGLTLAMTHGNAESAGVNCVDFYSDGRIQTYGSLLHLNKGAASTNNVDIKVSSAANPPALRWNGSTTKWQLTNDGTSFFDIASSAGGITGSGTANRLTKWTSASDITSSALGREANSRLGINMTADPTTSSGRFQINDFPASGGSTINFGNWNSTGFPVNVFTAEATNGGNTIASPFPVLVLSINGVSGQSFATTAALALTRYSTTVGTGQGSLGRLSIQVNNASNDYPTNTMQFYGTGRAGIGNGTITTTDNDAKTQFHVGGQLTNAGTNYSTTAWGGGGGPLLPFMVVFDAADSTNTTLTPEIVIAKKGVAAGQEACRAEFGVARYESSSNAPRTRLDIRCAHATNETTPPRIASFMSYGGFGVGLTSGTNAANDNPAAILQSGNTPGDLGSYSITSWNSTGSRVNTLLVTPNTNGGSSPSAAEPALVLSRRGVSGQAFSNFADFKISRYENVSTNARTALTIGLTHQSDAAGIDVVEFRSDTSSNFKGLITFPFTYTAGGTTGNQTINKPSGSVNIAAAGTAVTVTNSLVTTNSVVFATVMTNDTTAQIKNVVVSAGSFTINVVSVTAETKVGFLVINQ